MGPVFTNINLVFVNEGPDFLMVGSSFMGPLLYGSPELVLVVQIALSKAYTIQTSSENEMERFLYQLCLSNSLSLSFSRTQRERANNYFGTRHGSNNLN